MKKRSKNWKKYTLEFLSIFVAVISAFALNNWNDNRNNRNAESKILSEIRNGLDKDLEDIHMNQYGHEEGVKASAYFHDLIAGNPVPKDSFLIHYFNLTRDFISIQNTSGYETLQSKGLELVEDDKLRSQIISLFEYDYNILRKMEEEYFELQFQQNYFQSINDMLAPYILLDDQKRIVGIQTPIELTAAEERQFLIYLWKMQANRNFVLGYYSQVEQKVLDLRVAIEEELQN